MSVLKFKYPPLPRHTLTCHTHKQQQQVNNTNSNTPTQIGMGNSRTLLLRLLCMTYVRSPKFPTRGNEKVLKKIKNELPIS